MIGSTYISNPDTWTSFYRDLLDGKIDTNNYKPRQTGGRRKRYAVPLARVTPMKAVEERAAVEFRQAVRDGDPHVPLQKAIKGTKRARPISLAHASPGITSVVKKSRVEKTKSKPSGKSKPSVEKVVESKPSGKRKPSVEKPVKRKPSTKKPVSRKPPAKKTVKSKKSEKTHNFQ
ncbi:hypothetical protein BOW52_10765 [Solemya elarraichensis gill symbiont]|uniref:Uncharacterized protein n=1 Tax=Solemya elarraichensis gill symbiont TaxID=1918949 RepID=A0A1T2KUB2_9GAMM|nr:hypothetical protein BOW52_10765 [Solemya elarraichensis gill symbiont]